MPEFQANDVEIHYDIQGDGPPIAFISSLAAGGSIWDMVVSELVSSHRCLTFDNRGAGKSSSPRGPYTIAMLANDLTALADGIGLNLEETLLVGQSMGGFIALELALERRSAVAGLVLVSTAAKGDTDYMGMSKRAREVLFRPAGTREEIIRNIVDGSLVSSDGGSEGSGSARCPAPPSGYGGSCARIGRFCGVLLDLLHVELGDLVDQILKRLLRDHARLRE